MNEKESLTISFGEYRFTPSTGELVQINTKLVQSLTPTESKILEYLCLNRDKTVPRDELLAQATGGRVVGTDNINTHIKKIRKALGDSASKPSYIRTHPNSGYRFIAPVIDKKQISRLSKGVLYSLSVLLVVTISLFVQYLLTQQDLLQTPIPITSLKGNEIDGDATGNGEYIVFSHKLLGKPNWNLVIKMKEQEEYFHLTNDDINDRRAKFSPSGNRLLYHHYSLETNQVLIADINWKEKHLENIEILMEFPVELSSIYLEWKNEQFIYYSSYGAANDAYRVSILNLETRESQLITDPSNSNHGDTAIIYSAIFDQLVILRYVGWSKTDIMLYDIKSKSISKLASFPRPLLSIALNQDETGIIFRLGNGQLGLLDIETRDIRTILNSNSPAYAPFSMEDGLIGFMRGDLIVSDIAQYSLTGNGNAESIISSSYNDYLPAFAQNAGSLAFVSTRSGQSQIWLKSKEGSLKQISNFHDYFKIINITIDTWGKYIAYTANDELHLMDVENGEILFSSGDGIHQYDNPVFSKDGDFIFYSIKEHDRWQLEKRAINNIKIRTVITEGYIAKPCENNQCIYFIKYNQPTLYKMTVDGQIKDTGINLGNMQFADQFDITDNNIYFANKIDGQNKLLKHDIVTNRRTTLTKIPYSRFSLNYRDKIVYWALRNGNDTNLEAIIIK